MPAKAKKKTEGMEITPAALESLINKEFGAGTVMRASDPSLQITRIPTGILSIDDALGGGFARGRHFEIYGSFSVGKTYVSERLIANCQALGGRAAFIDCEGTFDPGFATKIGIDIDQLAYHRQEHGNKVVDFMEMLLRSRLYDVIVLDSIAALLPMSEAEAEMSTTTFGTQQAKLMSQALRKLTTANKQTAIVFINQTREAIGVTFGKRTTTSGGRAMAFYAGTRIEMVRTENIKRKGKIIDPSKGDEVASDIVVGHRVLVRIEKDKTGGAMQHSTTSFVFNYEQGGIDPIEDLIYLGRKYGFVHKRGDKWWVDGYDDEQAHGRPRFKKWLRTNRAVAEELEEWILNREENELEEDDPDLQEP